jgi:hypothetical protein
MTPPNKIKLAALRKWLAADAGHYESLSLQIVKYREIFEKCRVQSRTALSFVIRSICLEKAFASP